MKIDVEKEKMTMEIRVKFESESSLFKITPDMKFMDLLMNIARYWSLEFTEFVLIDNLYNMWPYDSNVMEEQLKYKVNPTNFVHEDIFIIMFQIEKLRKKYLNIGAEKAGLLQEEGKLEMEVENANAYRKDFVEERLEYEKTLGEYLEDIARFLLKQIIVASGEVYNESTQKRLEREVVYFLSLFVYLLFVVILQVSIELNYEYSTMNSHTRSFNAHFLEKRFILSNGQQKNFYELVNRVEALDFLQNILQIYYQDTYYNGQNFTNQDLFTFRDFNLILGQARLRQKRVSEYSCAAIKNVQNLGPSNFKCYDLYSPQAEEKSEMDIVLLDFWYNYTSADLATFSYQTYKGNDRLTTGYFSSFDMSGYISYAEKNQNWNSNSKTKYLDFFKLYSDKIWDISTRVLILEMNYYVINTDFTVASELVFEQLPTGGIKTVARVIPFKIDATFKSNYKISVLFDQIVLILIVLIVLAMFPTIFVRKIRKHGCKAILKAAGKIAIKLWSLMTFFLLALVVSRLYFKSLFTSHVIVKTINYFDPLYKDIMSLAIIYEKLMLVEGLTGMVAVFLIYKFFKESLSVNIIWQTLSQGKRIFFWYFLMFIITYSGFVFAANFFFGQFLFNYSSLAITFETLINVTAGKFDFYEIWDVDTITAPIFFTIFIIIMYFLMTRIFLAIFLERYEQMIKENNKTREPDKLFEIIYGGWIVLRAILFPVKIVLKILHYPFWKLYIRYVSKRMFIKSQKESTHNEKNRLEREKLTKWMKEGDVEIRGRYTTAEELDDEERQEKERRKAQKKKNPGLEKSEKEENE